MSSIQPLGIVLIIFAIVFVLVGGVFSGWWFWTPIASALGGALLAFGVVSLCIKEPIVGVICLVVGIVIVTLLAALCAKMSLLGGLGGVVGLFGIAMIED